MSARCHNLFYVSNRLNLRMCATQTNQKVKRKKLTRKLKSEECSRRKRSSKILASKKTHMLKIIAWNFVREQLQKQQIVQNNKHRKTKTTQNNQKVYHIVIKFITNHPSSSWHRSNNLGTKWRWKCQKTMSLGYFQELKFIVAWWTLTQYY